VSVTTIELPCQFFNFKGDGRKLLKVFEQAWLQISLSISWGTVVAVVNHHAFIRVKADRKFARTAAAGFFDAPDAAIAGQVVFRLGMSQVPDLAHIIGNSSLRLSPSSLVWFRIRKV
jgi:hypothetical protein